jgi:hypothetical protein
VKHIWERRQPATATATSDKRSCERRAVSVPARLAWKDQRGVNRFASVTTRDVSDFGVFVESPSALSIPLFRLVQFQVEPNVRGASALPAAFRQGRILSAVYRVSHAGNDKHHGLALRLLVEPKQRPAHQFTVDASELRHAANS